MKEAVDLDKVTYIGETEKRGSSTSFGIREEDRSRHVYVIGQTGTGKSTLLELMAIQDIQNGAGLVFLDPHGSSADNLLNFIPRERLSDTIHFAPHLTEFPIGLNIMEDIGKDSRHLVASSLISSFHRIWGEGTWSSRMEHILNNTLLALLEYPNTTLLDINRMYSNKVFRNEVVARVTDPQVKSYWVDEFARYSDRYTQDATPAIQNKVGQFTSNPVIRNIIGQPKSAFDFRDIMDSKKILLINLSKGLIGDSNARLLGVLFTTKLYLAALSRSNLTRPELAKAPASNFYVDEFQSFANESFASILSEARKYKLNLVMAHQYIGQLDADSAKSPIRDAVFGNVGTFISFRVGPVDAEVVSKQFAPAFSEEDVISLPKRHMYLTLNISGSGSTPFLARTANLPETPETSLEKEVKKASTENYGKPRDEVELRIKENLEKDWNSPDKQVPAKKKWEGNNSKGKPFNNRSETKPERNEAKPPIVNSGPSDVSKIVSDLKRKGGCNVNGDKDREAETPQTGVEEGWSSLGDLKKNPIDDN